MNDRSSIESARVSFGTASVSAAKGDEAKRSIRMVWVGELSGDREPPSGGPIPVDRDGLGTLFLTVRPRLELEVPNRMGGHERVLEVRLDFEDFCSFKPETVAQALPTLRSMLAVRSTLERLVGEPLQLEGLAERLIDDGADTEWARAFQRAVQSTRQAVPDPAPSHPEPRLDDSRLSELLSQVAMPGEDTVETTGGALDPFERMVRQLAGATGRQRRLEKALAGDVLGALDAAVGKQLENILHHPRFLALESAWRSLKHVVDRTHFRKGISLEVLSVGSDQVAESVERDLFRREYESPRSPSLVAVWIDHEFDASARDVERLERLASMAESLGVPFAASVGAHFFGVSSAQEVAGLSPIWDHLKRPEYIPFTALRAQEASRHLALTFPRLLTRMPYRDQGARGRGPHWNEPSGEGARSLPWGTAVAALASRVSASHVEIGWPSAIRDGWVEDLPIAERDTDSGPVRGPLDASLGESMLSELADQGFAVLAAPRDSDRASWLAIPMLHRGAATRPGHTAADEREDSLAYRLLAAQVTGVLRALASLAPRSGGANAVRVHFEEGLRAELDLGRDESLAVVVEPAGEGRRGLAVGVHLLLTGPVPGVPVEIDLGIVVGGA